MEPSRSNPALPSIRASQGKILVQRMAALALTIPREPGPGLGLEDLKPKPVWGVSETLLWRQVLQYAATPKCCLLKSNGGPLLDVARIGTPTFFMPGLTPRALNEEAAVFPAYVLATAQAAYRQLTASLGTEINPSPSPCESQRTGFDSDWQIPKIASRGIGDNLDEFGDDNGEKLPEESDEEEVLDSPRESERESHSSEDEVEGNGIDEEEPDDGEGLPGESDEEAGLRYHRERDGDSSEDEVEGNGIDDEEPDDEEELPEKSDEEGVLEYPRKCKPEEEPDDEEEDLKSARDSELDIDSSEDEVEGNEI
ncbi:hypothetical protein B0H13DRAFT_1854735 [Mycena leptocephala]|nr:hypothetical protein B0H13DRAFT_1854735 [Mycena leptocephala]